MHGEITDLLPVVSPDPDNYRDGINHRAGTV
jgi:hypothetical protein